MKKLLLFLLMMLCITTTAFSQKTGADTIKAKVIILNGQPIILIGTPASAAYKLAYWKDENTLTFITQTGTFVFGAGGGNSTDTAAFSTSTIYGSFYNNGTDTLIVAAIQCIARGTNGSLTTDIMWSDTLGTALAPTHLLSTPPTVLSSAAAGTTISTFTNTKIPPGKRVWMKTPTITTKPTYLEVTLSYYWLKP